MVVDEAHHGGNEEAPSREYQAIEQLAESACRSILLLTATPEQLGMESHFARLRLLDRTASLILNGLSKNSRTTVRWPTPSRCCWRATS
ncbi:hypothetical protein MJ575_04960 [Klebsiella pneumoniae]|nr:hypothetical protein MJ575_04960 [Klebsiella pneumoniae]